MKKDLRFVSFSLMTASKKVLTTNLRENHVNYFSARLKHQWFDDGNEAMQVNGVHVKETCSARIYVRTFNAVIDITQITTRIYNGFMEKITQCLY